uniref:ZAD domain-containing protein n=1 Tax=Anopheles epiroticus TaxID=199890 RepID=A0A182PUK1_9DIPT
MDNRQQNNNRDTRCRLCLKHIEVDQTAGIDLLQNQDINRLLLDVYRVEVLQTDEGPTMVCVPCYMQLVNNYKLRIRCLSLRKNFRLNQAVLMAQVNAFKGKNCDPSVSSCRTEQARVTRTDENRNKAVAVQIKATQPEQNPQPAVMEAETENTNESAKEDTIQTTETTVLIQNESNMDPAAEPIVIDDESNEGSIMTLRSEQGAPVYGGSVAGESVYQSKRTEAAAIDVQYLL